MIAESIVGGVALGHLLVAPFTKVEESFNMQACHDLLYHGPYLSQYDHLEYPGVVPRSFLGPMVLSSLSLPFVIIAKTLGISKFYSQYIVRMMLGLLVVAAWRRFYGQVKRSFGVGVAVWFTAITVTQFHFMYYLTRALPNTFALVLALLACSYWLEQNHWMFVVTSGIGIAVFRIDLVLMLAPMLLHDLYSNRIHWTRLLWWVASVGTAVLVVTVVIDSALWGRLLWPEGEVFWFNTARNQSHLWGTLPLLWYWYSALPRALGASYLLVPLGLYLDERMRLLTSPAFALVGLYSLLPHKELRFIIYALPLLNVAAASACQHLWRHCRRNAWWSALCCGAVMHLLVNCTLTALLLTVSAANYPGGAALVRLQQLVPASSSVSVHIDNLAAQSGVTRFLQLNEGWIYNKTEELRAGGPELRSFTHLLVEAKTKYAYNLKHYTNSHNIMDAVDAFSHLSFNYQHFPPVKIRMKPTLYILENLMDENIRWPSDKITEAENADANGPPSQGLAKEPGNEAKSIESPLEDGKAEKPVYETNIKDNKKTASKKKKEKVNRDQSRDESVVKELNDGINGDDGSNKGDDGTKGDDVIIGDGDLKGDADMKNDANIESDAKIEGHTEIKREAEIKNDAEIKVDADIKGDNVLGSTEKIVIETMDGQKKSPKQTTGSKKYKKQPPQKRNKNTAYEGEKTVELLNSLELETETSSPAVLETTEGRGSEQTRTQIEEDSSVSHR